ncbi:MAG: hypothetical protein ACI915_002928 [Gammaproteobacteria bacterium]|jgi:uncharacterized protein (TIGR02099 family)
MFARLISALWTGFAALTIVLAIVVTIIRLALPHIDHQRIAIESWLSDLTQRPVQIGEVSASWRGWAPTLDVTNFVVRTSDASESLVRFDYAIVSISPLTSLFNLSLTPRKLIVGGMKISLERDIDGKISVAGMPPSRWPVAEWLLQQQNFSLKDAEITFTESGSTSAPALFSDVTISIAHDASAQSIVGSFKRRDQAEGRYAFALRATGDLFGPTWDGELVVDLEQVEAESALLLAGWHDSHVSNGSLDARIWSRWENAKLQRAVMKFAASDIEFKEAAPDGRYLGKLVARVSADRQKDGWSMEVDELEIGESLHSSDSRIGFRLRERPGATEVIGLRAQNINVSELALLAPADLTARGFELNRLISPSLEGTLHHGLVGVATNGHSAPRFYLESRMQNLSLTDSSSAMGVQGLDFDVRANQFGGVVSLDQPDSVIIESPRRLVQPLKLQKLIGDLRWTWYDGDLRVTTEQLNIQAATIDFTTRGSVLWNADEKPEVTIVSRINSGDVSQFHLLIPKGSLRPRGESWMRAAFASGQFKPSHLAINGDLGDFPFDHESGTLKAEFVLTDVDLKYSKSWPATKHMDATIAVDGRKATTTIRHGQVYTSKIDKATIEMPDLFSTKPAVRVRGKIRVRPDELSQFIDESPLKNTKAARYSDVEIAKPFAITLDMNLSLYPAGDKEILGLVHFDGNRIAHRKQNITLDDFTGDISFTRADWYGEGLQAVFDGMRVGVVLNGGLDDPNYDTEFRMTGTSDATQLSSYLKRYSPLIHGWLTVGRESSSIVGQLPWKAVLTIPAMSSGQKNAPQRLTIESSLLGLDVDLPWPFGKSRGERKPLVIRSDTFGNGDRHLRVDFGSTVDVEVAQGKRPDGSFETHRAEFVFGEQIPNFLDKPGFTAHGEIDRLPLNEWIVFANAAQKSMVHATTDVPATFDVKVQKLETLGRTFADTRLVGQRNAAGWSIDISGPKALGTISLARDSQNPPLTMSFERLWLDELAAGSQSESVDPRSLPSVNFDCKSLHFGDIDLGVSEIVAGKVTSGLNLEKLSFSQPNFSLRGSGEWSYKANVHRSAVQVVVEGETLAGLLKSFGFEVANIDGGKSAISIAADWHGMPSEFTLDKLYGSFDLNVEQGRFLDIEPGPGRLFGLLSLQTLPRRISLDFNDLFKRGFSFDVIDGTFQLDKGNAYTNSLAMTGPSARINISGRTGLADQDYDQRVIVTPALSNTIPVASALFGPAGIGVGAVIYLGQKMFKSIPETVDKLLSREYSITGNWKQPIIERI